MNKKKFVGKIRFAIFDASKPRLGQLVMRQENDKPITVSQDSDGKILRDGKLTAKSFDEYKANIIANGWILREDKVIEVPA